MTSSMLTGDRRWASARRSGMTVLGKVAVPKPINLPSQRLENHGLDPNVDIVPKGTHSWGTRSSPSTTNPWGSLNTPSPNNDGTGSPSYISGRPSSGGSGTRPSTAGSDRAQEPNSNAWGSNSRPSSASGTLTSSQSSLASLRPRSAETRPGSSQLSRFAEPSTDSSVAWGANRTAEKLGMTSAKNYGFSLTTGDFPTLGSEKETSGKSTVSEDADHGSHGRPGSSHGGAAVAKEMAGNFVGSDDGNSNIRNDASNSWRRENHMYGEDGTRNSAEKWHQDHQPYPNSNIPHHQFDAWRGPPVNSHHGGVWYRGLPPPGGPPFGSPVGPGGFPMEPFPYYRPHIPPGTLNNPPPTGAGLRGPRPKNGDMYRPHMPDAYMRPGAPIRPGFYPGPIAFDGYYGHPMGYCSSNERDIPFMGMPMGPAAYNPYSGQNVPDPGNSRGRTHGPSSKGLVSDQMESGHLQDGRGPYKVLLKQHDGWEGRDEQKWDENASVLYLGKGDHPKKSWENGWRGHHKEVEMDTTKRAIHEEGFSESSDNRGSDSAKVPEDAGHLKASDDSTVKDKEQFEPLLVPSKDSPVPREPSLIQKIKGLNAKARASDGRQDALSASSREEQKKNFQANDGKKIASVSEAATVSESFGNPDLNTSSNEGGMSTGGSVDLMVFGGTTTSRKSTHGMHGGTDRRAKGRFNSQETDGWRKIPQAKEPPILVSPTVQIESSVFQGMDSTSAGAIEEPGPHSQSKSGEPLPAVSDPNDSQSQRARMTELVKQRFKQREKEEEEREREQRAKAQAKLEELNRRTQAGEVSSQKQETVPNNAVGKIREESSAHVQHTVVGGKSKGHNSVLGPSPSAVAPSSESIIKGAEISTSLSGNALQGTTKALHKEVQGYSVPVQPEASNSGSRHHENDPHAHDIGAKQKRYRQKQQSSVEKNSSEKSIATATGPSNGDAIVLANATVSPEDMIHNNVLNCESILPVNQGVISDSSLHHKRKNRSNKSKHKVEEATSNASLPSKDATASDIVVESKKATDAKSMQDPGPVKATIDCQTTIESKDASQLSDQGSILANEEVHGRATNQWKSQHPRKPLRNSHSSKSSEKIQNTDAVFWVPVRSHKYEVSDEANQRSADVVSPSKKNEQQVPNNTRNKRAEMERYVPKPAVKEMSQQGSSHQSATSNYQTMSDETIGKSESSTLGTEYSRTSSPVAGKVGSKVEYRHGDSHIRQNKSGKGHGAWRQRATTESSTVTSDTNRNFQKPTEHHPHQKLDSSSLKEHSRHTDDGDISDGWNIPEKSDEPVNAPGAKEQGMMIKGKRYKATGYGHHFDEKRVNSGSSEKVSVQNSLVPEMKHSPLHATSKENCSVGERSGSHWQPKASAFAATNEQGSRSNDGHDVIAEVNTSNKKDSTFHGGISLPQRNKESTVPKSQHHQDGNVEKAQVVAPKEPKEGRKIDVHEQRPVSPVNLSSSNMGTHHEQRGSSGFRKNGNQNSRFGMEHEHNGDWSGSTKDGKQHNVSAQREKQRQSSHHEYQPIGPDSSITDNTVPTKDGSRNSHGRYKERGQTQPRRSGGNFNGRRTGNVGADPNYE